MSDQQVAERDTTFDNVVPERLWISTRTTPDGKHIRVIVEINGIEKELERIYVGGYDGVLSSSTQLTWVLNQANDALKTKLQAAEADKREYKNEWESACERYNYQLERNKELQSELDAARKDAAAGWDKCEERRLIGDQLTLKLQAAEGEIEKLRLQLAGCGVAAMCNTKESAEKQRIAKDNPYWSASYGDVCNAVDREIGLREALALAVKGLEFYAHKDSWKSVTVEDTNRRFCIMSGYDLEYFGNENRNSYGGKLARTTLAQIRTKVPEVK